MDIETLIAKLNRYPPLTIRLSGQERQDADQTILALLEFFEKGDQQQRCHITRSPDSTALGVLYGFSQDKAIEGRRNCSRKMIRAGLLAAVMGGGSPHRGAVGSLTSVLLRSAVVCGFNPADLFSSVASFACDDRIGRQIREFPLWPSELRDMSRFGMRERRTADGIVYEHVSETPPRKRWWQFWVKRYKVDREEAFNELRAAIEREEANKTLK